MYIITAVSSSLTHGSNMNKTTCVCVDGMCVCVCDMCVRVICVCVCVCVCVCSFWQEKTAYTPESRLAVHNHLKELKEKEEKK